jgi:putative methionine-R-sulfoxide reductase with GAF domain
MERVGLGRIYSDNEIIFKEGDIGDMLYVIQSGKVKISKKTPAGEFTINILQDGDIFGEMAIFDRLPRSATATALSDVRILTVDKKKLFQTISKDPTLVFKIIETMSKRIRRLDEELAQLRKNKLDILHICIDIDEICEFVLEEARNILHAENGSLMLLDDKEKLLSIRAAFGTEWNPKIRFILGEGIAGDVLKTGRAELVNNVSTDSRYILGQAQIKSLLCVPLKWKGHIFGVINMSNSSEKLFTIDELKVLHSIAIYTSIAIENAKVCSNLRNITDEVLMHVSMLDVR